MFTNEKKWIKFLDFAFWWNNYNFEIHNWNNDVNRTNVKKTFELIIYEFDDDISKNYEKFTLFYNCLYFIFEHKYMYLRN